MNSEQEIDSLDSADEQTETDSSVSVDDFIRELEAKEKDLHITAETTVIELAEAFDDGEMPDFIKQEFPSESEKPHVEPVENTSRDKAAKTRLEAENKQLREKLAKAEDDRDELMKASLRRTKDFENFKARVERERRETFQNQVSNIATEMLPALDNLNRAVDFAAGLPREERSEFQQFVDGVVLVNQQVNEVLSEMGIEPILTIGEPFDPHLHEAAATEETDEFEPNTISGEMLKGYRIGDRVVRHSIVRVARALPKSAEREVLEKMFDHDSGEEQSAESKLETEETHD